MKVKQGMEKEYQDWKEKNSDGYSSAVFMFAEKWAELIEAEIEKGNKLQDVAEELEKQPANEFGLTGFQYGCAISILSQCWEYGEELRVWHNGDYNYEGEGVVNPAILTIGKTE